MAKATFETPSIPDFPEIPVVVEGAMAHSRLFVHTLAGPLDFLDPRYPALQHIVEVTHDSMIGRGVSAGRRLRLRNRRAVHRPGAKQRPSSPAGAGAGA